MEIHTIFEIHFLPLQKAKTYMDIHIHHAITWKLAKSGAKDMIICPTKKMVQFE